MAPQAQDLVVGELTTEKLKLISHVTSVDGWLAFKRDFDGIDPKLWRIHDDLYDLSDFVDKHPGGRTWIEDTQGTDITEAFEVAHVFGDNLDRILRKYHVRPASGSNPRRSPYTFHPEGFYNTLKKRVQTVLREVGTGPTQSMLVLQDLLMATTVGLIVLVGLYPCGPILLLTALVLGLNCSCAHNFFHQRDNFRMYFGDISGAQSRIWRVSHMLSHHLHTNSPIDVESTSFLPFINWFPVHDKSWPQRLISPLAYGLIYFIVFPLNLSRNVRDVVTGVTKFRPEYVLPWVPLIFWISVGHGLIWGLVEWTVMHGVAGLWVIFSSLVATHHHPTVFHGGDVPSKDRDWGICQMDATRDVDKHGNLFLVATSFGDHLLHHLFPTVDHSKLHLLYPSLNQTMKEFGIQYPMAQPWQMFTGMIKQMMRTEPNTYEARCIMRNEK
eukprot:snap_masked-scaffold763_size101323-processed-gene-0.12 protein:Tk04718 transcript:snap_masked-scaffold763_size101323-processed-gene-0.12-mRNA-1 annotation:"delta-6 desaturase-like protein"